MAVCINGLRQPVALGRGLVAGGVGIRYAVPTHWDTSAQPLSPTLQSVLVEDRGRQAYADMERAALPTCRGRLREAERRLADT
jgi:hypothetical protein